MQQADVDALAAEILDPDLPGSVECQWRPGPTFTATISQEQIEADGQIVTRSVLLCRKCDVEGLESGDPIMIDGDDTYRVHEPDERGRAFVAFVLSH